MTLPSLIAADRPLPLRASFLIKVGVAFALIALADWLFFERGGGSTVGGFAVAWIAALLATRPALRHDRRALLALAAAGVMAASLVDAPGPLALVLFWFALGVAALAPRFTRWDHAGRWLARLSLHTVGGLPSLVWDAAMLHRLRRRRGGGLSRVVPILALPVIGSVVFLMLFARANPLIEAMLVNLDPNQPLARLTTGRVTFWIVMLALVWTMLRPTRFIRSKAPAWGRRATPALPGLAPLSVGLSLLAFNALFAVQNLLDIAFLWSGAPLPDGVTLADYAHRGAYPLIVTALLAGLIVLVALRPGSQSAGRPALRRLVYLWIGQNVFLVASSILRTLDYIEAYSMTSLRLAALIWMVLVAVGLLLICWQIARSKSSAWLINANAAAALGVLVVCSFADLGEAAAAWNVRYNREVGGRGVSLDLCYLWRLGPSALRPLIELEGEAIPDGLKDRVRGFRNLAAIKLARSQADWRSWTWRDARRLAAAQVAIDAAPGGADVSDEARRCPDYEEF